MTQQQKEKYMRFRVFVIYNSVEIVEILYLSKQTNISLFSYTNYMSIQ